MDYKTTYPRLSRMRLTARHSQTRSFQEDCNPPVIVSYHPGHGSRRHYVAILIYPLSPEKSERMLQVIKGRMKPPELTP